MLIPSAGFFRSLLRMAAALAAVAGAVGPAWAGEATGRGLYEEHCASCHGDRGQGDIGLPLSQPDFLRIARRDYLIKTMKHGRPGRVMPSFEHLLTEEQRGRIAEYILSWREGPRAELPEVGEGDPEKGAQLFQQRCAECHGYKGQGGERDAPVAGHMGGEGRVVPPALNNAGFLAAASDEFIKATLRRGREGTAMPDFGGEGRLTGQQMDHLVAYIRSWESGVDPLARPVIQVHSDLAPSELIPLLKMAINSNNFVFIRHQTLYEDLPGDKPEHPVHILHFCRFGMLHRALSEEKRVGTFLPCQITVYRQQGHTVMSAINPKALSPLFHNPEIELHCSLVSKKYLAIMREANF
jgi:cytochrome c oxidase cbb3-type subunit 3